MWLTAFDISDLSLLFTDGPILVSLWGILILSISLYLVRHANSLANAAIPVLLFFHVITSASYIIVHFKHVQSLKTGEHLTIEGEMTYILEEWHSTTFRVGERKFQLGNRSFGADPSYEITENLKRAKKVRILYKSTDDDFNSINKILKMDLFYRGR